MELSDKVLAKTPENWVYATALIAVLKESLQQRQIEARIAVTWGTTLERRSLKEGLVRQPALRPTLVCIQNVQWKDLRSCWIQI